MNKYRLKKEAVPFMNEKHATQILTYDSWENYGIDINALEEVEDCHLTFGHSDHKNNTSTLAGWNTDDGSHFHFTIHFPSTKHKEHDEFSNGRITRGLMDSFQRMADNFFSEFVNDNKE